MSTDLDQMLEAVVRLPSPADASAVFGVPTTSGDRTIIPAAAIAYDFDLAAERHRSGAEVGGEAANRPDQGRGGIRSRPVAVIELTREATIVRPIVDMSRLLPRVLVLAGWAAAWLALASALRSRRES